MTKDQLKEIMDLFNQPQPTIVMYAGNCVPTQELVYKTVEGIIREAVLYEKLSKGMRLLFAQETDCLR